MQTRTYTQLFDLIKALSGVNAFTTEEQAYVLAFVNRRALEAYNECAVWPRYLVVGEQRTLSSNLVPWAQTGLDTIEEIIRVHRTQPFLKNSSLEYEFYVDVDGAHMLNLSTSDTTSVYVTYKKQWEGPYTTATTTIPLEWFHWIAHASYADFLRMDGQTEKALTEELVARKYLDLELERVEHRMNNSTINKRISTYINRQAR